MLLELLVENYAVVEQARIRFQEGLNILTGETGSGKSIVVDSLSLLLGARASAEMVRTGEARARVSGIFAVARTAEVSTLLEEAGIDDPEEDLIIEREISANGKSRAFVANRPVTTAFLRQLAPALGDIHGQNEQQLLAAPQLQRDLLDDYANAAGLRASVAAAYAEWRDVSRRLEELEINEQEKLRLLDLWSFQRKEIEAVQPERGEDEALEGERKILQNVTRLQENANAAFSLLYDSSESAATQVRQAIKKLDELLRIDGTFEETAATLRQAGVLIDEAAYALRDYLGKLEGDPARLEDVEARLEALDRLKRKYGRTLEDVIAFREDVARRIEEVENASEHRSALERKRVEAANRYEKLASELSRKRKEAAATLSKRVESELKGLAMAGTQFQVSVNESEWTAAGIDEVVFLVSPNRGEELKPLQKIASGGELSRIALALKTAIGTTVRNTGIPTLVFDEVDAGVGGAAAAAVGKRLKLLSRASQVICVTHLAQIAGFADHHYAVSKREKKGRITTQIEELEREQRAREIGRMLSGEQITAEALRHAEQLIQAGMSSS
ncbi:MAG: DNA repair protein RecN [Acidobacteriaceae bacterium]|nr:DNA repair protein RecN [Acidobacteriaceae bacterium]MBV8570550.1 DNA repair protein RecN [Acidobacteriaceae bacterium]